MIKFRISNLNPFNNHNEMSTFEYVLKKLFAFFLIYAVSAIIGEAIIIGILYGLGYDPLHGSMPEGLLAELLPYYGFLIFLLVAVAYCKFIEKRTLKTYIFTKQITDYFAGTGLAVLLLFLIFVLCYITNAIVFVRFNISQNLLPLLLYFLAFVIQGAAEEMMCRGFLFLSLLKKTNTFVAMIVSSTAFAVPHLFSLFESELTYAIIGTINLYLISAIFSLLVLLRSNIWIACGLHSIWNFIIYGFLGLSLSGSNQHTNGIVQFSIEHSNLLNGGKYGIEASIITTLILVVLFVVLLKNWKGKVEKNGIS